MMKKPFVDNAVGRTYVPVRFVSNALGLEVNWVEAEQKVEIIKGTARKKNNITRNWENWIVRRSM
ncbi:MAG: copper amine oxidase N-terminal domain-containing protein [Peptococcaceae bacterium]|nr:copper amine oxidase N-terminal domain-containing protein [Peptococcaceae bacterium]